MKIRMMAATVLAAVCGVVILWAQQRPAGPEAPQHFQGALEYHAAISA